MYEMYREQLKQRILVSLSDWTTGTLPDERAVYHFLHGLKGTAATLGITDFASAVDQLMNLYHKDGEKKMTVSEVLALTDQLQLLLNTDPPPSSPDILLSKQPENQIFALLIDSDLEFANFLKDYLETKGITIVVAPSGAKGLELFYSIRPNLVLIDLRLPDMSGIDVLDKIAVRARQSFVPVAVLAADAKKEEIIRTLNLGTTDFIQKPIDPEMFLPYVLNRITYKNDIQRLVIMDELTGAYNRRYLSNKLSEQVKTYKQKKDPSAFVIIDLDHFKQVNDSHGHAAGDNVLRTFAQTVKQSIREKDILFRQGGEEFSLLLPSTTKERAKEIVLRIRSAFNRIQFPANGQTFSVTFSAGITETDGHDVRTETLLREADQALYYAKEHGRDQVYIYNPVLMGPAQGKVLEVVLVDEDPLIRAMLTKQVANYPSERFTLRLHVYKTIKDFLEASWYKGDRYYMILLDTVVFGKDALLALKQLRSDYPRNKLFISMLTAREDEEQILEALELGADDYMLKPFRSFDTLPRIKHLTKRALF